MEKRESILTVLLIAAGVLAVTQASATIEAYPYKSVDPSEDDSMAQDIITGSFSDDEKVNAFLRMIRKFESNDRYNVLYGGKTFSDYSKHPWEGKPLPKYSASGAYQFIIATWLRLRDKLGLPDFSPESQDMAALELLNERGATAHILDDDIDTALRFASKEWASLPYSNAGQNPKPLAVALDTYQAFLNA